MRYFTFAILIEKEPGDEGYFAYSPTLPGCFSMCSAAVRPLRVETRSYVRTSLVHWLL
jgi:hypothetical protein